MDGGADGGAENTIDEDAGSADSGVLAERPAWLFTGQEVFVMPQAGTPVVTAEAPIYRDPSCSNSSFTGLAAEGASSFTFYIAPPESGVQYRVEVSLEVGELNDETENWVVYYD